MLRIYTDGACHNNGKESAKASWAFVVIQKGRVVISDAAKVEGKQSNNTGELTAIYKAIEFANKEGVESTAIYSDSKYAINSICHWNIEKRVNGKRKKNYELIKNIQSAMKNSKCDFELIWVKGHSGNRFNELADQLATNEIYT